MGPKGSSSFLPHKPHPYMDYELINNEGRNQYEFHVEDSIARIEYILKPPKIYLTHTEVPSSLEGKGVGSQLVLKVLEEIKKNKLTLIPLCPFVAAYLKRHPKWMDLLDSRYRIG